MGTSESAFVTYLQQNLQTIEDYVIGRTPAPARKTDQSADLDRYLYGPIVRFVASGGKRIRPALCLLGAEATGAPAEVALPVAAAVELFQSAALIHDDIADKGDLRRGMPCMHITEGVGLAVNAGDGALVAVTSGIVRDESFDLATKLALIDEICAMEERTLEGQALDLGWARDGRWDITVDDYLVMARHKTAYYSAAIPLVLGAICGGGSAEQIAGLRAYGMRCGLAFQIQDDLLNLVGDPASQGKDFRTDISEGKRTLVMVRALARLEGAEHDELVSILSSGTTDKSQLARAVELAEQAGAIQYAQDYAHRLARNAKEELATLNIADEARAVLLSMADFFVERRS